MTIPLLQTKLYIPPVRSELVPRPRLIERLNAGFHRKLTLVSAPAGFGKTTLLSEWVRQSRRAVAWLSLDPGDDDANRFWRYVVAALQTIEATIGETARAALESPQQPPLDTLVTALINDVIALPAPLILVLDDYHLIRSDAIHTSVNFLLDHAPSQMHLVIATREDPPLGLSRRRGRVEMAEIRTTELRFTAQEIGRFLNTAASLNLPADDIAALQDRTEGWIVGLQMAAISLQEQDPSERHDFVSTFAGDDRYVVDYLMEEVFQRQAPHIQTFLLQTSILERLCGPLCDAITGAKDSQAILEYLEQANLFSIPLDNRRHWYRYHRLFADLLRKRLGQFTSAQDVEPLYLRASQWCESEELAAEAIAYSLALADPGYAVDLIEHHVLELFYRSEIVLVHNWLNALPKELIRTRPLLCAVYGNCIILATFSPDALESAERWLRDAEKALAAQARDRHTPGEHDAAAGFIATFRAYLARFRGDDPQAVVALSLQALEHFPKDDLRFRSALAFNLGMAYQELGDDEATTRAFDRAMRIGKASGDLFNVLAAARYQANAMRQRGRLHEATAICRETLQSVGGPAGRRAESAPYAGAVYIAWGRVLLEWNDLDEAKRVLTRGLQLAELTAAADFQVPGCVALAQLERAWGNVGRALDLLDQAEQAWPAAKDHIAAHRVCIWLAEAKNDPHYLTAAIRWAQEHQAEFTDERWYDPKQLALARLLIVQRQMQRPGQTPLSSWESLLQFLDRQFAAAQGNGFVGWMIEVSTLQAMAMQASDNVTQANVFLDRALVLGKAEGYVHTFVEKGTQMARLLYQAAQRGIAPEYANRLLTAFETEKVEAGIKSPPPVSHPPPLIEALSKRELEVLRLIAEGLSNKEIAQKLFLSPNTVRIHASNIYGKLGVHKRTQAVMRAQDLGIL